MIIFDKDISQNELLTAYNNNILEFHTDSVTSTSLVNYAEIIENGTHPNKINVKLYPSPTGSFYFNFKEHITSFINTKNFADDLDYNLTTSQLYNVNNGHYHANIFTIKVHYQNGIDIESIPFVFLAGVKNKENIMYFSIGGPPLCQNWLLHCQITSPPKIFLKKWKGYPIEVSLYSSNQFQKIMFEDIDGNTQDVNYTGNIKDGVFSLFLCDGYNETIVLSNVKKFHITNSNQSIYNNIEIEEVEFINCDRNYNVYLKFVNRYGRYSYWLFNRGRKNINPKGLGELQNNFNNLEDTISPTVSIGTTANETLFVTDDFDNRYIDIVKDIIVSPKIFLFTGSPNNVNTNNDWIEVNLKDKTQKVQDAKLNIIKLELELELPKLNTITI